MSNIENSIMTYFEEQAEETEKKVVSTDEKPIQTTEDVNSDDFDMPKEDIPEPSVSENIKSMLPVDAQKEARNYTLMIDMTQKMIFTGIHTVKAKNKVGGKEPFEKAQENIDSLKIGSIKVSDLSPEERKNCFAIKKVFQKIERLPMTSSEKEYWNDALEGIVIENGYKMSPGILLVIASINMMASRLTDVFID
jgi:hypothetical protein